MSRFVALPWSQVLNKPTSLEQLTEAMLALPTSEPVAPNLPWLDNGVLALSQGIPPTITDQPDSITVGNNLTATFSVVATNATGYQWQRFISGTWTNINGATSTSYTTPSLDNATDNGAQYRCVVTGLGGSTNSSAAVVTVAAHGENPAEAMIYRAGPVTPVLGSAAASGITWFSNWSIPVAGVLKEVSLYAGAAGTVKLKVATPNVTGGWTVTNLQTLTVVSGVNTFQVSDSTLAQQNIPAQSMIGIYADSPIVRVVADDFLIGYTYFNGDVTGQVEAGGQAYASEIQLSFRLDAVRGAGPNIFEEAFGGTIMPSRNFQSPAAGWTFGGGAAIPTGTNKFLVHNYTSNCDRRKVEVDFRITDMNTRLCLLTAPIIGGASTDEGACIAVDFTRNSILHYANTSSVAIPVAVSEDSIGNGITMGVGINWRLAMEKVGKVLTARITNRDTTATFATSRDNTGGAVSGLGYGAPAIACYEGVQALATGFGVEVTDWRSYAVETNPSVLTIGDSIAENPAGFSQLLIDELDGQGWYDADGGTTAFSILRRWMYASQYIMPKYVVIMAGANNANSDPEAALFATHMAAGLDRIIRAGSIPIVCYVTPNQSSTLQARINTMNAALTGILATRPAAIAVRTDQALSVGRDGVTWDETKMSDAVHFDEDGHAAATGEIITAAPHVFIP